eukprot:ctg_1132.g358
MTSVAASAMTQSDPSAQRAPTDTVSAAHIIGNVTLDDPSAGYGALRLQPTGLSWAAREGTYSVEVARVDLEALWWLRGARGYQLRCRRRDGTEARFEALRTADRDAIDRYARKVLGLSSGVQNAEQASRGWNFGQVRVHAEDDTVQLETGGERALAVPLSDVAQALRTGRNEVSLEFHLDDTAGRADENLVEMRFQLPSEEDAEALQKAVAARADTTSFAGESIAFFEELPLIVPRGVRLQDPLQDGAAHVSAAQTGRAAHRLCDIAGPAHPARQHHLPAFGAAIEARRGGGGGGVEHERGGAAPAFRGQAGAADARRAVAGGDQGVASVCGQAAARPEGFRHLARRARAAHSAGRLGRLPVSAGELFLLCEQATHVCAVRRRGLCGVQASGTGQAL